MPTEVRRISFAAGELAEAFHAQAALPGFDVDKAGLAFVNDDNGAPQLQLTIGDPAASDAKSMRLGVEQVGAALVRFCLERGIPIPQNASRSLSIHKGKLALYIHMDEEAEEAIVELPAYYDYDFYL